jgi:hypothetical protein
VWKITIVLLCLTLPLQTLAKNIRNLEVGPDGIVVIHTAVGYSTILDFSSKPLSAVLGDQDSFKLEYLGKALTIKPLTAHGKSNLFIFTEFDRFTCTLVSGSPIDVDYIVHINEKSQAPPTDPKSRIKTARINRQIKFNGFSLKVKSVSDVESRAVIVDFLLSSSAQRYDYSPKSIGVKQGSQFLKVETLYLDSLALKPGDPPVYGKLAILDRNLDRSKPVTLIFAVPSKNKKAHRLELQVPAVSRKKGGP